MKISSPKYKWRFWLLVVLLASFATLASNINNDWVNWDDESFVLNNPSAQVQSFTQVVKVFSSIDVNGGYTPLVLLSWSIDYAIAGHNPHFYHASNVLIHLVNVVLVFAFILLLTKRLDVTIVTAVLFGIHPTQLEPVAWITSRKDLLYAFFYLASLISYVKYTTQERKNWKLLTSCFGFFIGALLSKGMAVTLPLSLMVIDLYNRPRGYLRSFRGKIPFFVISIGFGLVAIVAQKQVGAIDGAENIPWFKSFFVACYGLVVYVFKALIPVHLSSYHPYPFSPLEEVPWYIYASFVPAVAFIATAALAVKKNREVAFGMLFFLCSIVFVLQLLPVGVAIIAERYTYVANIGLFFLIALSVTKFAKQFELSKRQFAFGLSMYLGVLALTTMSRTAVWANSETLWTDVIQKYPSDFLAYNNRAGHYASNGDNQRALVDYNVALELHPEAFQVYKDRGFLYLQIAKFSNAFSDFDKVVSFTPADAEAYINRGLALLNMKKYTQALEDFNYSIKLNDNNPIAYFNRGLTHGFIGNPQLAITDLDKCLSYDSEYKPAVHWKSVFMKQQLELQGRTQAE